MAITMQAQSERKEIRKGTDAYNNKKYAESEVQFKKALQLDKNSYPAQFNIADALYKQEKYEEALSAFQSLAAKETNKQNLASIHHNIGNCQLSLYNKAQQQAQQAQQAQPQAPPAQGGGEQLDNAIASYKSALRNNSLDNETRYNLIAAEKMKEDNKNKDKNKDKQDQKQDQKPQPQDQKQQQQQQQDKVSKQDAQRVLDAMQQEEKDLQDKKRKVKASGKQSDKNW
jgi:hypothetical protein